MPARSLAPGSRSNLRGLALMTGGFFTASFTDLIAKFLTADYHPVQIVFTRQFGLVAVVLLLAVLRGRTLLRSVAPRLQFARGIMAAVSATSFVAALAFVPLADAVAVSFVAPFIVTILGAALLREPVGLRRWAAVVLGFAGTLIIIRPGLGVFHPAILLVVLAAAAFALRQIVSRHIGNRDATATTLAYTAVGSIALLALPLPFVWTTPASLGDVGLMVVLALMAGVAEFLFIRALETTLAVVLAPVHYLMIIFATFWGWLAFAELPDGWTWVGVAVIVVSGLYMLHREARSRAA